VLGPDEPPPPPQPAKNDPAETVKEVARKSRRVIFKNNTS